MAEWLVERSHRGDGKILYGRKIFTSGRELIRQVAKHEARYNKTEKTSINFKNLNQFVSEYFLIIIARWQTDLS